MRLKSIAVAIFVLAAAPALAQSAPPATLRGEIVSVEAPMITVKSMTGESYQVRLKQPPKIGAFVAASLADIKAGSFVGAAIQPQDDGSLKALEVHIFPEALRGTGEGTRAFDLTPGSVMTNGNVSAVVDAVNGPTLTITFFGQQQKVQVDKTTPIVALTAGTEADVKPGASVILRGIKKADDGVAEVDLLAVGRDGLKLPM